MIATGHRNLSGKIKGKTLGRTDLIAIALHDQYLIQIVPPEGCRVIDTRIDLSDMWTEDVILRVYLLMECFFECMFIQVLPISIPPYLLVRIPILYEPQSPQFFLIQGGSDQEYLLKRKTLSNSKERLRPA